MRVFTFAARRHSLALLPIGLITVVSLAGCIFQDVRKQQAEIDTTCNYSGTVRTEHDSANPLVVGLARHTAGDLDDPKNWELADHFVSEFGGSWEFRVGRSTYALIAFEDSNADGIYQLTEPFLRLDAKRIFTCTGSERVAGTALVIPTQGRSRLEASVDLMDFHARTSSQQQETSLGHLSVYGKVTTLDDPKFNAEVAADSLWRPYDFLINVGAGVYFLEPYDPKKIPVLFVHGINGSPIVFRTLVSRLDRKKYQPWFYYYPSGGELDLIAGHLDQVMKQLQLELGFKKYDVVAHSMGGLVARGFLLRNQTEKSRARIPLFMTLATPWGGHSGAEAGVKYSPTVVRVWNDMVPGSPYIQNLFFKENNGQQEHRALPDNIKHHLLFAFKQSGIGFGEANDGVATLSSQLFPGAQTDAARMYGFNETHTGILDSVEVSTLINRLLDEASSTTLFSRMFEDVVR